MLSRGLISKEIPLSGESGAYDRDGMKGALHQRLRAELLNGMRANGISQESLGAAMDGKSHRSVGQYLDDEAGALDLDEADAALQHVGSSLEAFLAKAAPRTLTPTEKMARALVARPALIDLVEDLLRVPKTKLSDVIELTRGLSRLPNSRRGAKTPGSNDAPRPVRRTTKAPKTRR